MCRRCSHLLHAGEIWEWFGDGRQTGSHIGQSWCTQDQHGPVGRVLSKTSAIRAMAGSTANSCKTARSNTTVRISPSGATTPLGARSCPPARSPHSVCGETAPVAEENPHYAIAEIGKVRASRLLTRLCLGRFGPIPDGFGLYPAAPALKTRFDGMVFRAGGPIFPSNVPTAAPVQVALIGDDGKPLAATVVTAPALQCLRRMDPASRRTDYY